MSPERWERLKELFEAALEIDPARRSRFLKDACGSDEDLRAEAESLIASHQEASSFLPTDATVPDQPFSPTYEAGYLAAGRFRITRFIGHGGMGEVYEAWDEGGVQQAVALKILLPEISRDPIAVTRLRREIQNARLVTHRNVCRVFDFFRDERPSGDIFLLTMELIEGETLASRLQSLGPLSESESLEIARQISLGLDAAHAAGVIHRDLKPANIMLERHGASQQFRVIIADFGLARAVASSAASGNTLTQSGFVPGTPAYMAPELLAGAEPGVSSDIYSFGIILREMWSGSRLPVAAQSSDPAPWASVVSRCLDPDPTRRFTTCSSIVAALNPPASTSEHQPTRRHNKRLIFSASAVLAVALLAALIAWRFAQQRLSIPANSAVLLADIDNLTPDPQLSGVTDLFRTQLDQSAYFSLWDRRKLSAVLQRMRQSGNPKLSGSLAREIAYREGVPVVVSGSISPIGDHFLVNALIEQLEPSSPGVQSHQSASFEATNKSSLFTAIHDAASWIRRSIGEHAADLAARDRPPEDVTTPSWLAFAAYSQGERAQREGNTNQAIEFWKNAVTLDPHFALALMRLGDMLSAQREQSEGLRYWLLAKKESEAGRLTRRESLRLSGLFAGDTWDYPTYCASFSEMKSLYPHDYLASFYLANALQNLGRFQESVRQLEEASQLEPANLAVAENLALAYNIVGNRSGSLAEIQKIANPIGRPDVAQFVSARISFSDGQFQSALESFTKVHSSESLTQSRALWFQAASLAELGRFQEAKATLRLGIDQDGKLNLPEQQAIKTISLAYISWQEGDSAAAHRQALAGAALAHGPRELLSAAILLARLADFSNSTRLVRSIQSMAPNTVQANIATERVAGETYAAQRDFRRAIQTLTTLDRIDSALQPRDGFAVALESDHKYQQALPYFQRASTLQSSNSDSIYPGFHTNMLFHQALCFIGIHQATGARETLELYLSRRKNSDPNLSQVAQAKKLLSNLN